METHFVPPLQNRNTADARSNGFLKLVRCGDYDVHDETHDDMPPRLDLSPLDDLDGDANRDYLRVVFLVIAAVGFFAVALFLIGACSLVYARNLGGRYDSAPLHAWFEQLKSGKGLCCSFADGRSVADPDWGTTAVAGAAGEDRVVYWVIVDGQKLTVPDDALIAEPNRDGRAIVWPYQDADGKTQIRCFMPGAGM